MSLQLDVLESCQNLIEQYLAIEDRCALHQTCKNLFRDPAIARDLSCLELFGDQPWPATKLDETGLFCFLPNPHEWPLPFLHFAMHVWSYHSDPRWQNHLKRCVRGVLKDTEWKLVSPWPFYYLHLGHEGASSDGDVTIVLRGDNACFKRFGAIQPNLYPALGQLIGPLIKRRITYLKYTIDLHDMRREGCLITKFYEDCLRMNEKHLRIHCECIIYPQDLMAVRARSEQDYHMFRCAIGAESSRRPAEFARLMRVLRQSGDFARDIPFPWNEHFITYTFVVAST